MGIYVRPFKKADLNAFKPIENMLDDRKIDPAFAQAIEDSDLSVTGIRNGKVVGCGGVHPVTEEQGEVWLRLSADCLRHRLDTIRWLREGLAIIEKVFPFKQLNAAVRCDFKPAVKLAKFLGFCMTEIRTYKDKRWYIFSKRVQQ